MRFAPMLAVAAAVLVPQGLAAQTAGTGTSGAGTGTTAQVDTPSFIATANSAGMLEVESSRLALKSSKRQDVTAFANMMVDDHMSIARKMQQAIAESGGRPAATSSGAADMNADHKAALDRLAMASGDDFDNEYIALQRKAHQEAVALFTGYSHTGTDPALKAFATETLPVLLKHAQAAAALGQ